MTHRRDNHSADDAFDAAVHEMHAEMARGSRPSCQVWNTITRQAGIDTQVADRNQSGSAPSFTNTARRQSNEIPGAMPTQSPSYLNWSTWLAVALVVLLIAASINFLMMPDDQNDPPEKSIALAPGTPDMSSQVTAEIASPVASPGYEEYIPVYGPEFACTADSLTKEEVYQIVLNPHSGWSAKNPERYSRPDYLFESNDYLWIKQFERENSESYIATNDVAVVEPITETANMFWNCLMTGTAFQVWSMMEPDAVQREILRQYPVLRDEATLRKHIEKWGPRKYSASIYHEFPDLGNVEPYRASMHVEGSYGSVRIGYSQGAPWKALVLMASHPQSDGYGEQYLLLTIAPDGNWWVSMIFYE